MAKGTLVTFDHIGLYVSNLKKAKAFFVDTLQLDLLRETNQYSPLLDRMIDGTGRQLREAWLRFPETVTQIRLIENTGAPLIDTDHANPGTCHVAFYTDDMVQAWTALERAGARLISTGLVPIIGGVFDGGKAIYCAGPDAYRIEFLEGPAYLDGRPRNALGPTRKLANEATHIGIHVRDRDKSLAFYLDLLKMDLVAAWLEKTAPTKAVIGYPEAELNMAILRLPGTHAFFEVIEYQKTNGTPVDTRNHNNGTLHLAFRVNDLEHALGQIHDFGSPMVTDGIVTLENDARVFCCEDPDGIRVLFIENR